MKLTKLSCPRLAEFLELYPCTSKCRRWTIEGKYCELSLGVRVVRNYSLFLAGCLPPWDSFSVSECHVFGKHNERKTDVKGATQLCYWVVAWTRGKRARLENGWSPEGRKKTRESLHFLWIRLGKFSPSSWGRKWVRDLQPQQWRWRSFARNSLLFIPAYYVFSAKSAF